MSCALRATIKTIKKDKLLNKSLFIRNVFHKLSVLKTIPFISDVRVHGAGVGIEFISNKGLADNNIVKKIENMLKKQCGFMLVGKRQCINVSTSFDYKSKFLRISLDKLINEINQIFLKEYKC